MSKFNIQAVSFTFLLVLGMVLLACVGAFPYIVNAISKNPDFPPVVFAIALFAIVFFIFKVIEVFRDTRDVSDEINEGEFYDMNTQLAEYLEPEDPEEEQLADLDIEEDEEDDDDEPPPLSDQYEQG